MTDISPASRPVVRLIPKAEARAIRHGFPWVYANELVTDRRTRALTGGTIAVLEDANRTPMGVVTVNPASKIFAGCWTRIQRRSLIKIGSKRV